MIPPSRSQVRRTAARALAIEYFLLWLLLLAALFVIVNPLVFSRPDHPTVLFIQHHPILTGWFLLLAALRGKFAYIAAIPTKAVPLDEAGADLLGPYTPRQIREMVTEIRAVYGVEHRETPSLYAVKSPQANAASVNAPFRNGKPRLNAIYICSSLFKILTPEELTAVLGHELAHFYRYSSPLGRAAASRNLAAAVLYSAGLELLLTPAGGVREYGFFETLFIFTPLFILLTRLLFRTSFKVQHSFELGADLRSATAFGALPMINALLKISSRGLLFNRLYLAVVDRLQKDPTLDTAKALALVEDALPDAPVSFARAMGIIDKKMKESALLSSDTSPAAAEKRASTLGKLQKELGRRRFSKSLDWKTFDTHVRDNRLDAEEAGRFIEAVRANPRTLLFPVSNEEENEAATECHPTVRSRILFIADNCPLERTAWRV